MMKIQVWGMRTEVYEVWARGLRPSEVWGMRLLYLETPTAQAKRAQRHNVPTS